MGLSVKWATCNIGARLPEESGWYFQWAGTIPYNEDGTPVNGGDPILFDFDHCPYSENTTYSTKFSKYNSIDNQSILELEDDAAHICMGDGWRTPSEKEYEELLSACNIEYKEQNNEWQMILTNKTDSSKQLIFPLANCLNDANISTPEPVCGLYWTNSVFISRDASPHATTMYVLPTNGQYYSKGYHMLNMTRCIGASVRGVC